MIILVQVWTCVVSTRSGLDTRRGRSRRFVVRHGSGPDLCHRRGLGFRPTDGRSGKWTTPTGVGHLSFISTTRSTTSVASTCPTCTVWVDELTSLLRSWGNVSDM